MTIWSRTLPFQVTSNFLWVTMEEAKEQFVCVSINTSETWVLSLCASSLVQARSLALFIGSPTSGYPTYLALFRMKCHFFQTKQAVQKWKVISWSCLRQCSSPKVTVILMGLSLGEVLSSTWGPGHALVVCWCGHCLREFILGRGRGHQESPW